MNSVRSNDISLKCQRCTTLGSKDIGIINSEFVSNPVQKKMLAKKGKKIIKYTFLKSP